MPDQPLRNLRNLGPVMERRLRGIGIESEADLRAVGSLAAWTQLRFVHGRAVSLIALHAMEAALLGCDWRHLPPEVKERLNAAAQNIRAGA